MSQWNVCSIANGHLRQLLPWLTAILWAASASSAEPRLISIDVDASDAPRRLFHSRISMEVSPGKLTLMYPRWGILTYGAPAATVDNIVGLRMQAGDQPIKWARDPVDMFAFHLDVPANAHTLEVSMDVTAAPQRTDMNVATGQLLIVDWQTLFMYPQGADVSELMAEPRLRRPKGWQQGSAMHATTAADETIVFPSTSLASLVDSPVLAGKYFSTQIIRNPGAPPLFVHIAADTAEAAKLPADWQSRIARIETEAGALFGGFPYREYHFLFSLSDQVGNDGLEHRESSDIRMGLPSLHAEPNRLAYGYLIPHEYTHAWNGKFAIPAGLVRRDFQEPQTTELLWVYEGLTRYLNWVLGARAGVLNEQEARDYVALLAAEVAHRPGRAWRSLQDTAVSADILFDATDEWESLRRSVDYYDESLFIWLEVDAKIRERTQGRRSLDDFCRQFFGPPRVPPDRKPYVFDDVVATLNAVTPYDWRTLLRRRLDATGVDAGPLGSLTASGWALRYRDMVGSIQSARDQVRGTVEERYSVGLLAREGGEVVDVIAGSPAWRAGIGPGMKIIRVNSNPWSRVTLRNAIANDAREPLMLTVQNGVESMLLRIEDTAGARYPYLERSTGPDVLAEILKTTHHQGSVP